MEYLLYFVVTLGVSTLFGIAGLGSSLVLIPLFTFLGLDFNLAKAMGLFINGVTTLSLTFQNVKSKILTMKELVPLFFVSATFAFMGAWGCQYIAESIVKILFILFILLSLVLLFIGTIKPHIYHEEDKKGVLYPYIAVIAFIGGLIGVGGGAVYLPLFLYIGIKTKQSIALTSALIPIVSFSAFITYSSFVEIDWVLLGDVAVAALIGSFISHKIVQKIHSEYSLKIIISMLLFGMAIYMIYLQFLGN